MRSAVVFTDDQGLMDRLGAGLRDLGFAVRRSREDEDLARLPTQADLCLYDLGTHGGESSAELEVLATATPKSRWIALTAIPDADHGLALLALGVRGYCNRWMSPAVLEVVLQTVLGGGVWAGQEVTDHLLAQSLAQRKPVAEAGAGLGRLTPRERAVAEAVAGGESNKVIAANSGISERTVKAHLNAIYRKTGIRNRVQLALAWRGQDAKSAITV